MASKRRGGFRPPELRGTLGTLLRTTTGVVRDALERGAREGRARLDDVRSNRRRHDALADLGELVLDLIRAGEIDLAELPEARDLVRHLDELDSADAAPDDTPRPAARSRFDDRPTSPRGGMPSRSARAPDDDSRGIPSRGAFPRDSDDDSRGRGAFDSSRSNNRANDSRPNRGAIGTGPPEHRSSRSGPLSDGTVSSSSRWHDSSRHDSPSRGRDPSPDPRDRPAWRTDPGFSRGHDDLPFEPDDDDIPFEPHDLPRSRRPSTPSDDGTVSSGATVRATRPTTPARPRPPETESSRAPTKPMKGPWRRPDPSSDPLPDAFQAAELPEPESRRLAPDPHRKGGISFDDDDLNEYMHPDDVPPKGPPRDPDGTSS